MRHRQVVPARNAAYFHRPWGSKVFHRRTQIIRKQKSCNAKMSHPFVLLVFRTAVEYSNFLFRGMKYRRQRGQMHEAACMCTCRERQAWRPFWWLLRGLEPARLQHVSETPFVLKHIPYARNAADGVLSETVKLKLHKLAVLDRSVIYIYNK